MTEEQKLQRDIVKLAKICNAFLPAFENINEDDMKEDDFRSLGDVYDMFTIDVAYILDRADEYERKLKEAA